MPTELEKCMVEVWLVGSVDIDRDCQITRRLFRKEGEAQEALLAFNQEKPDCINTSKKMEALIDPESGLIYLVVNHVGVQFGSTFDTEEQRKQKAKEAALEKLTPRRAGVAWSVNRTDLFICHAWVAGGMIEVYHGNYSPILILPAFALYVVVDYWRKRYEASRVQKL